MGAHQRLGLLAGSVLLLASGCAQILGVEPGRCAPEIDGCEEGASPSPLAPPNANGPGGADVDSGQGAKPEQDGGKGPAIDDDEEPQSGEEEAPEQQLCEEYCTTIMAACPAGGEPERPQQYASEERCITTCVGELNLADSEPEKTEGNTIDCRLLHAQLAGDGLETRSSCQSAGLSGGDVCGILCDVYCELVESVCKPQFESSFGDDFSTCVDACEQLPLVDESFGMKAPNGDHMQCRMYHLQTAISAAIPHCDHAVGASPCQ